MSSPLTPSLLISLTDKWTAEWLAVVSMASTVVTKAGDLDALVAAIADRDLRVSLDQPLHSSSTTLDLTAVTRAAFRSGLLGLRQTCASSGVLLTQPSIVDINSFATYYNTGAGGPYQALLNPSFAALWNAVYPTQPLSRANVFSPAVPTMATWVQGTGLSAGATVSSAYGGCPVLSAIVTGWGGAGGTCSFAVTGLNGAGAVVTDTWTVTIAANGTYSPTGSVVKLVQSVTNITPTSMTAGTIVVSGGIPAGRSNPPT